MIQGSVVRSALLAAIVGSSSCKAGNVGDPCIPDDEYGADFTGYGAIEANVESQSFECASRVCLVNHFQGRVSCPYGQTVADLGRPGTDPRRCRLPGTSGQSSDDVVRVPVDAWDVDRPASDAVYCSCRCAGPDPNARYCTCPSGYACREILPNVHVGLEQMVGSYCVRNGTEFRPVNLGGPTCANQPDSPSCPRPPFVNP